MIRTDLALEMCEYLMESSVEMFDGIQSEELNIYDCKITRIDILNENGAKFIGRPTGRYVTIDVGKMNEKTRKEFETNVDIIAKEILNCISSLNENIPPNGGVLICGLGNGQVTPDALGPEVVKNIMVTRHLDDDTKLYFGGNIRPVAAISPGVLGQTGLETAEIIKSLADKISPALIIVIDALAARKLSRIATTVQISNVGIVPGSGVGNRRSVINRDTLGIPVISVGVPTIVDAATMAGDIIGMTSARYNSVLGKMEDDDRNSLIRDILKPYDLNLMVTPTDIDIINSVTAKSVGFAINRALHKNINFNEMETFLS